MLGDMKIPKSLRERANEQDGLVTRAQALSNGLTDAAIRHALEVEGDWRRIVWGVYATFTGELSERHYIRAALLYAGDTAILTGSHACRGYGMVYAPDASVPELLVPEHVKRAKINIAKIRRAGSMPASRSVHGIPCAPPERAALDATRRVRSVRDVRATLCEVVQRRLTTVDKLLEEYGKVDKRGMWHARLVLDEVQAGCRSAPECELREAMLAFDGFPEVRWNQPLPEADDLVPDAYIRSARLVLEVESMEWHQIGNAPELTERRRARYASLGWRVMPLSPRRIREEPQTVVAEIAAAVAAYGNDAA